MGISVAQGSTALATNGSTATIFFNAAEQNDIVLVFGGHGATETTLDAPGTGYTEIATHTGSAPIFGAWYKRMGATPDTSVACDGGGNVDDAVSYGALVVRGVDTSTALDVAAVTTGPTTSTNPNCASITTVTDECMVFALVGSAVRDTAVTMPAGYPLGVQAAANDLVDFTTVGAFSAYVGIGAEDPPAFSAFNSGTWYGITVALRPAAAAAGGGAAHLVNGGLVR